MNRLAFSSIAPLTAPLQPRSLRPTSLSFGCALIGGALPSNRPFSSSATAEIFDRSLKRSHYDRASLSPSCFSFSYLRDEIASRLIERLDDFGADRKFSLVADAGCGFGSVAKAFTQLQRPRKIREFYNFDFSLGLVSRCRERVQAEKINAAISERHESPAAFHFGVMDQEYFSLKPNSFDLIISCASFHWLNQVPNAFQRIHAALKEDGCFLAAFFGGKTLRNLDVALSLAGVERFDGHFNSISPFLSGQSVGELLSGAGFALPTVDTEDIKIHYPDFFTLASHIQGAGENNALSQRSAVLPRSLFVSAASIYENLFRDESGLMTENFEIIYAVGWKPHPSQQKAKARGSAKAKLASEEFNKVTNVQGDFINDIKHNKNPS